MRCHMKLSTKCSKVKIFMHCTWATCLCSINLPEEPLLACCPAAPVSCSRCLRQVVHIEKATFWWLKMCVNLFIVLINVNSLQLPAIKGRCTSCCMQHTMWQPVALVRTVRMINAACQPKRNAQNFQPHTENFFLRPKQNQNPPKNSPKKAKKGKPGETCIDMIYYQSPPYTIVEILFRLGPTICLTYAQFSISIFVFHSFNWKNWII